MGGGGGGGGSFGEGGAVFTRLTAALESRNINLRRPRTSAAA